MDSKAEISTSGGDREMSSRPDRTGWHKPLPEKLPEPTAWPVVLAFGACLMAWGIVTSWIISAVGLIVFAAGVGGWIARMRDEGYDK